MEDDQSGLSTVSIILLGKKLQEYLITFKGILDRVMRGNFSRGVTSVGICLELFNKEKIIFLKKVQDKKYSLLYVVHFVFCRVSSIFRIFLDIGRN